MKILITVLSLLVTIVAFGQQRTPQYRPIPRVDLAFGSRQNADSSRSASVAVGLWSRVDTLRGLQLGVLGNVVSERMSGLQLGVVNAAADQRGLQIGLLSNSSFLPLHGVQVGFTNVARGIQLGTQLGGLNINSGDQRGFQVGLYNYTDTLCGLQAGLINVNSDNPTGFQFGIVNISGGERKRQLGLVNINPTTRIQFMAYAGNYDKLTFAARFRNHHTYSIIGVGSYHSGLGTGKYSGSIEYRVGKYFNLNPRLSISGDIGYSHIETFREETATRPERLFSIQGRINLDYQINRYLGAFISGGYGQTRWYNHHRKFRDKPIIEAGMTVDFRPRPIVNYKTKTEKVYDYVENFYQQHGDSASVLRDAQFIYNLPGYNKKHPWWAAAEVTGINVFVHTFDRFILGADYAKTNLSSMAKNFRTGFVWDNDQFSTNQFAHPYHGNLYFNSARANGLNFWASFPYALGGSLMWEFLGETDPPAINDVISTSIGGAAIGEVFFRTSALFLDDSKRGWPRFWRELGAAILDPMRAFNRIIHGDAWRVRSSNYFYHDYHRIPVDASVFIGERYVADQGYLSRGSHNIRLGFHLEYGDAFADEATVPYDYFSAELGFNLGTQPFLSDIHLIGRLYGRTIYDGKSFRAQWGVFQHFDYYASDSIKGSDMKNPFEISETAAFGPGLVMQVNAAGNLSLLEQRMFVNGIILGGSKSDYYNFIDRDYNIGSGYGWKSNTKLAFRKFGLFSLNMEYYRLWTWKGFENKDYMSPDFDLRYLNAQGDRSNAQLFIVEPRMEIHVAGGWSMLINGAYYIRSTHYHYHPNKNSHTYEATIGMTYHF